MYFGPYRETPYSSSSLLKPELCSTSHNAQRTNVDESRRERRHARSRARRRQPLFLSAAQSRQLSPSGCLGWAEGVLKCHGRTSDGDAAIEVWSVFWVDRSVLVGFGRSSWLKNWLSTAMISFEVPPPGYAVLWLVGVGAAVAPVATR